MNGDQKRVSIFNKYAQHLQTMERQGLLGDFRLHFSETYICPVCLEQFPRHSLYKIVDNVLTLEDVPQKALGGSPCLLTCYTCNNFSGVKFDHHLVTALKQSDQKRFLPKTRTPVEVEYSNHRVQGEVNVLEDGTLQMFHATKGNNPKLLTPYIESVKPNLAITVNFKQKTADRKQLSIALLKTAYLLAFRHYGYTLILDPVFDSVRKQLQNPDQELYPYDYWHVTDFPVTALGVPFVVEPQKRCILAIFNLKTEASKTQFSVYLPLPGNDIISSYNKIRTSVRHSGSYEIEMRKFEQNDCLFQPDAFKTELLQYV